MLGWLIFAFLPLHKLCMCSKREENQNGHCVMQPAALHMYMCIKGSIIHISYPSATMNINFCNFFSFFFYRESRAYKDIRECSYEISEDIVYREHSKHSAEIIGSGFTWSYLKSMGLKCLAAFNGGIHVLNVLSIKPIGFNPKIIKFR